MPWGLFRGGPVSRVYEKRSGYSRRNSTRYAWLGRVRLKRPLSRIANSSSSRFTNADYEVVLKRVVLSHRKAVSQFIVCTT